MMSTRQRTTNIRLIISQVEIKQIDKMKKTELRIGNYVGDVWGGRKSFWNVNELKKTFCIYGKDNFDVMYRNLRPIKLNKEWLTKLGFVKDDNASYWIDLQSHYLELVQHDNRWTPIYAQVPELSNEDEQRVSMSNIEHVHQLQNLYFALTGKELKRIAQ